MDLVIGSYHKHLMTHLRLALPDSSGCGGVAVVSVWCLLLLFSRPHTPIDTHTHSYTPPNTRTHNQTHPEHANMHLTYNHVYSDTHIHPKH